MFATKVAKKKGFTLDFRPKKKLLDFGCHVHTYTRPYVATSLVDETHGCTLFGYTPEDSYGTCIIREAWKIIFLSKWVICRFQPLIFQGVSFSDSKSGVWCWEMIDLKEARHRQYYHHLSP